MNEQDKSILPFIICPNCVIKLELDESEMAKRKFVFPQCQNAFDINKDKFKKASDEPEDTFEWMRIFSYNGSIGRIKFLFSYLFINLFLFLNLIFTQLSIGIHTGMEFESINVIRTLLGFLLGELLFSVIVVKRLHDLNRPGTHFWQLLIPLYDIYLFLVLFFKKGISGIIHDDTTVLVPKSYTKRWL